MYVLTTLSLGQMILTRSFRPIIGIRMLSQRLNLSMKQATTNSIFTCSNKVSPAMPPSATQKQSSNVIDWKKGKITTNKINTKSIRCIEIEVNEEISSHYKIPGQYVRIKHENTHQHALFSLASPPDGRNILSFLIKENPIHDFLLQLHEGEMIEISKPSGPGFAIPVSLLSETKRNFQHILLIACGSGLAPIAAAIDSGVLDNIMNNSDVSESSSGSINVISSSSSSSSSSSRSSGASTTSSSTSNSNDCTVQLYIGAQTAAHLPYSDRYTTWTERGIQIKPVFSRPEHYLHSTTTTPTTSITTTTTMEKGLYVQDALLQELHTIEHPAHTLVLLCGMRDMTDTVREILIQAGVPTEHILLNY